MRVGGARILAALCAVALFLAPAGCGGESEAVNTSPAAERQAEVESHNEAVREQYRERIQAEVPTPEEQEAKQAATRFYEILAADRAQRNPNRTAIDSSAFCALMSEEAKEQTVEYAKRSSGIAKRWDCEAAIELLVIRSKRTGGFKQTRRAKVIGVNAEGDRATATVRFGKGLVASVPLAREDGEWKLGVSLANQ